MGICGMCGEITRETRQDPVTGFEVCVGCWTYLEECDRQAERVTTREAPKNPFGGRQDDLV
jgi:hypothetical protein